MRCRPGLRQRLVLAALMLGALALLAASTSFYGLTRTQALAEEALEAQRRIEAYGALSARVNAWVLSSFAAAGDPAAGAGSAREVLDQLDTLVVKDVGAARTDADAANRGRQGATVANIRRQVDQLEAALAATAPGSGARDAALAFYAADIAPVASAQIRQESLRRDAALAAMETLRRRLSRFALGIALAAPAVLAGLYLALIRPLFARLAAATAEAGVLAAGAPPAGPRGHDELGLLLARLRLTATRLARDRARLGATVAERTAALSDANDRLSQADTARRRFFADVSHELRTPLTVIMGEAELGMAHADPSVGASFATILGRAKRLSRRIEDLLRIARSESGQLELARDPVDLDAAVRAALADAAPLLARAGINAAVDMAPAMVEGDADWLRQVFSGLLENAAKYAGRGATVTITGRVDGSAAVVKIVDNGPGLPAGQLGSSFERFTRGPASAPGFGVGLALASWVVEAQEGSLAAETAQGGGLRLVIRLPLAGMETQWPGFLIVEDDPDIASLLCRGLGAAGYDADHAETADAAVERIERGSIDAAIIDMMLGADSGAELLAELRRRGHRMPALMLSALGRVEDRADGLNAGAQDYIVKPFQLSELVARLEVQLRRAAPREDPIRLGELTYDPVSRRVTGAGRPVMLTEREGELLGFLIGHAGTVLTRGEIFDALWAPHGGATENVVDVYLGYLRRKLGNFVAYGLELRTLRGRGFLLDLGELG